MLGQKRIPVTNAFCSCPLSPVTQGLTVTILLLRQRRTPTTEKIRSKEPPVAADHFKIVLLFNLEFCGSLWPAVESLWPAVEAGEGRYAGGLESICVFGGADGAGLGGGIAEGEGVKEGDGEIDGGKIGEGTGG